MNVENFRRRLLALERELLERVAREVETARSVTDDQADAGDLALVDETTDECVALAQTDSVILAQVRDVRASRTPRPPMPRARAACPRTITRW